MKKTKFLGASLAASVALCSAGAGAQEIIPFQLTQETNMVGAGIFAIPDFYGSGDYKGAGAPLIHYNFDGNCEICKGMYLQFLGPEIRVNLVPTAYNTPNREWRAGPLIRWRQRRDDDVKDHVVSHMQPVASAAEIGLFAQYHLPIESNNPLHKVVFQGDFVYNRTHVYDGATGNIRAQYFYPFPQGLGGRPLLGSIGFGLFFGSDHFANKYFGINGSDVNLFPERGGIPYKAKGGLLSIKIPFSLISQVNPKWLVTVAGRYERLLNDATDSPVVKDRGDENQWIIGVGAAYLF